MYCTKCHYVIHSKHKDKKKMLISHLSHSQILKDLQRFFVFFLNWPLTFLEYISTWIMLGNATTSLIKDKDRHSKKEAQERMVSFIDSSFDSWSADWLSFTV